MATSHGVIGRLRQPEYTGENRCMPCTVVNTIIGIVASVGIVLAGTHFLSLEVGVGAGIAFFTLSLVSIYLRGYLVPGTPELTKQYFPPWLLRLFGKEPVGPEPIETDIDPEEELLAAGALEECVDLDDLCLTEEFERRWQAAIERAESEDIGRARLLELLEAEGKEVEFDDYGSAFKARVEGETVGQWESEAAYLADIGAATVLEETFPRWERLQLDAKSQLLNGLRLFIETCPVCGGDPTFGADTVESCCGTYDVAAVACMECNSRLFESRVDV